VPTKSRVPAIEGWFTTDAEPVLLGTRCTTCGTVFFPRAEGFCRNPECDGSELEDARLSRTGTIWSFTDARYKPPPPYIAADPYEPFALAAVELAAEQMVVLGQVADGVKVEDLRAGQQVELVVDTLFEDEDNEYLIYKWRVVVS
jgi:uncharacterized OB-fold protein